MVDAEPTGSITAQQGTTQPKQLPAAGELLMTALLDAAVDAS